MGERGEGYVAYRAACDARVAQWATTAQENEREHAERTPAQQLKLLAKRPGENTKERTRLKALIARGLGETTFGQIAKMTAKERAQALVATPAAVLIAGEAPADDKKARKAARRRTRDMEAVNEAEASRRA